MPPILISVDWLLIFGLMMMIMMLLVYKVPLGGHHLCYPQPYPDFSHYPTRTLTEVKKPYPSQPAPNMSLFNCTFLQNKGQYGKCNAKYSILYVTISIWGHGEQVEKQKSCISFSENFLLKVRTFIWQLEEIKESEARLAKRLQFSLFTDSLLEIITHSLRAISCHLNFILNHIKV